LKAISRPSSMHRCCCSGDSFGTQLGIVKLRFCADGSRIPFADLKMALAAWWKRNEHPVWRWTSITIFPWSAKRRTANLTQSFDSATSLFCFRSK
jgi:hypothetical protein